MTALEIPKKPAPEKSRAETVRQRRGSKSRVKPETKKTKQMPHQTYRTGSLLLPGEPKLATRRTPVTSSRVRQAQTSGLHPHPMQTRAAGRMGTIKTGRQTSRQNGYDLAFSLGRTSVHAPAFSLPQLGPPD